MIDLGFELVATRGTARVLRGNGINTEVVNKVTEGRPDVTNLLNERDVRLIINTTEGKQSIADSAVIRRLAVEKGVCYTTTLTGGAAFCQSIEYGLPNTVRRLQELYEESAT